MTVAETTKCFNFEEARFALVAEQTIEQVETTINKYVKLVDSNTVAEVRSKVIPVTNIVDAGVCLTSESEERANLLVQVDACNSTLWSVPLFEICLNSAVNAN